MSRYTDSIRAVEKVVRMSVVAGILDA